MVKKKTMEMICLPERKFINQNVCLLHTMTSSGYLVDCVGGGTVW